MYTYSPLRYPGGKSRLAAFIRLICIQNRIVCKHYAEPFAGGAGVALSLLFSDLAHTVHINDVDSGVASFWESVISQTDELCAQIEKVPLSVQEWRRQRAIYKDGSGCSFERGFATFYLNRTNRSGVIGSAGVIGGNLQTGNWKMDARFDRADLVARIKRIASFRERIRVYNHDAIVFLEAIKDHLGDHSIVYLDPPYYVKGSVLYTNHYVDKNHVEIRDYVKKLSSPWIVSYDDVQFIRSLYTEVSSVTYRLSYSLINGSKGGEVMYFSPGLAIPVVECPASISSPLLRKLIREAEDLRRN